MALIVAVVALLALSPKLTSLAATAAVVTIVAAVLLAGVMTLATCKAVCDDTAHLVVAIGFSAAALALLVLAAMFATMVFVAVAGFLVGGLAALVNSQVAERPRRPVRVRAFTFAVSGALAFSIATGTLAAFATVAISIIEAHDSHSEDGSTSGPSTPASTVPQRTSGPSATGTPATSTTLITASNDTADPSASSSDPSTTPAPPIDCGADPWGGVDYSPAGIALDVTVEAAILERLRQFPFVYGGCPSSVEVLAAGLVGVTTACRAEWTTCSSKLLVTSPTTVTPIAVYELDIEPIAKALRSGRVVAMTERIFDGHTWWYDLILDAAGKTCLTYISSFDRVGLVMEPSMQYLVKDLMIRLDTILEPSLIQVDDATGEVNARFRPSKPSNGDGFIDVRLDADGGSRVVAASVQEIVGLSSSSGRSCRQSAKLARIAAVPHDSGEGPRLID